MDDFTPTILPGSSVKDAACLLWTHFTSIYQQQIAHAPTTAVPSGQTALSFIVAGYESGSTTGTLFHVDIPSGVAPTQPARSTDQPGPWWIGQIDVVARIINGFDPRALNLPFVQTGNQGGSGKLYSDMNLFDTEELTAYITTVHHALTDAVKTMMEENKIDYTKIERRTQGFLNVI